MKKQQINIESTIPSRWCIALLELVIIMNMNGVVIRTLVLLVLLTLFFMEPGLAENPRRRRFYRDAQFPAIQSKCNYKYDSISLALFHNIYALTL
jgi:hypothetical protein